MITKVFAHTLILIPLAVSVLVPFPLAAQTRNDVTMIYVDPDDGDDEEGSGNQENPFKTISQALKFAPENSIIVLNRGTYDRGNGELFPLKLTNGIILQGDPKNLGEDVKIEGGAFFNSPTGARQNITILATENAGGITGVTVVNTNEKGYGIWVESASPNITYNSFEDHDNAAIVVHGDRETRPIIGHNYIFDNQGKGILVSDSSQPTIEHNKIEKSGYGLSIVDNSIAIINNNEIRENRTGITIEGQATGILRNNIIENSRENGLIIMNQGKADLGHQDDPGGNVFHNQGSFAIKNLTGSPNLTSFGNQIEGKIEGEIDRIGGIARNDDSLAPIRLNSGNNGENNQNEAPVSTPNLNSSRGESRIIQPPTSNSTPNVTTSWWENPDGISINVPLPETNQSPKFQSPPPTVQPTNSSRRRTLADVLVVAARPVVDPFTSIPTNPTPVINNNQTNFSDSNTLYRVLVQPRGKDHENTVRSLYPNAKTTVYQGQRMLEVATSSDRIKVENILQNLRNLGVDGLIIE